DLIDELLKGDRLHYETEKRYIRKDGAVVWVLLTVSVVRDDDGKPLHFISQILDISDRKQAEVQLRSEADLDALTATLNRRRFQERLSEVIEGVNRADKTAAL